MWKTIAAVVPVALAVSLPVAADALDEPEREEFAIEGLERLRQAMERLDEFLRSIPRFETPYINEQGDIIIPRKPPVEDEPWPGYQVPDDDGLIET